MQMLLSAPRKEIYRRYGLSLRKPINENECLFRYRRNNVARRNVDHRRRLTLHMLLECSNEKASYRICRRRGRAARWFRSARFGQYSEDKGCNRCNAAVD